MAPTESALAAAGKITRDQRRALHAYRCVESVEHQKQNDYKIAINDLGANILRSGLAAAIAAVERQGEEGKLLLRHLAEAGVPGLEGSTADTLPGCVRAMNVEAYMIATVELLHVAKWLKRAVQATFKGE
jgi:CRISPR-associated protein Cmr5